MRADAATDAATDAAMDADCWKVVKVARGGGVESSATTARALVSGRTVARDIGGLEEPEPAPAMVVAPTDAGAALSTGVQ